jgi:hypothetical protein
MELTRFLTPPQPVRIRRDDAAAPVTAAAAAPGTALAAPQKPSAAGTERRRGALGARMPPQPQFRRAGRLGMSAEDREALRRLAAAMADTPRRWKAIAESDFGRRLGLDHRQLRHALKSKAYQPSTAPAAWSETLQNLLVAEVAARGRAWASIRRDGGGGAFAAFNVETLRRNYDHPSAHRAGYTLGGHRVRGMTRLPRGRFRVTFRERLVGQCDGLAQAARMWNDAARAAGVPADRLNIVPDEGESDVDEDDVTGMDEMDEEGQAARSSDGGGGAMGAGGNDVASPAGAQSPPRAGWRGGIEEDEVLGARILGALAALAQPRQHSRAAK